MGKISTTLSIGNNRNHPVAPTKNQSTSTDRLRHIRQPQLPCPPLDYLTCWTLRYQVMNRVIVLRESNYFDFLFWKEGWFICGISNICWLLFKNSVTRTTWLVLCHLGEVPNRWSLFGSQFNFALDLEGVVQLGCEWK